MQTEWHIPSPRAAYHCHSTAADLRDGIIMIGAKEDSQVPALKAIMRALGFQY